MSQIPFPASLKKELQGIAQKHNYPVIERVLRRGQDDELVVNSQDEAQALMNVARAEMLNAHLKYPFWDEDLPEYDKRHEEAFQDVQMGIFEKTVMYLSQSFSVETKV